ncbi:MAG: Rrf2 family transcriptional regulator [Candidatus Oxydemutatoraceae bacterium WSBS_2016_MAG_OTU14]
MRLTTRGRYAVTAMLDIALHEEKGTVGLAEIAKRQDIALSYLGQLFAQLRRCGLVSSKRGPGGGYCLAKAAEQISISDVIVAVEENIQAMRCKGHSNCQKNEQCLSHHLWEKIGSQIENFLSDITIAEVISESSTRAVAQRQDGQVANLLSPVMAPAMSKAGG